MTMNNKQTTNEIFRNFVAGAAVLAVITLGAMVYMELLR